MVRLRFPELIVSILSRRGESLIELIVALLLLELVGAGALAAALTALRLDRHARAGAGDDAARWQDYRALETAPSCVNAPAPDTIVLLFPATPDRRDLATMARCGR